MTRDFKTLTALLEHAVQKYGDGIFAVDSATRAELTFRGLKAGADSIAAALSARFGIPARSNVAILMPNCLEFLPIYFGILRANCVAVSINARLKADELQFILGDSEAQAVFVHPGTWKPAQEALKALGWTKPVIAVGFDAPPPGAVALSDLIATGAATPSSGAEAPPSPHGGEGTDKDDVAAIIYTSGTTGRPKGAMLTHQNILFNAEATAAGHGLRPGDVHLLVVPLFHVTGLNTIMPLALEQAGKLVVSSAIDPEDIIETIHQFGCTTFFGVPTTFYLLANLKQLTEGDPLCISPLSRGREPSGLQKLTSLRLICYSGAPMSPLTIQRLRELFPKIELHNFFGLTETTSCTTVLPDAQALPRAESIGLPAHPEIKLCIMDDHDRVLNAGEVGELCVQAPSVLKGYYKRPEATAEAIRQGWFHTGDTAYIDADGYVYLRGRKKEMAIVAGENVYPVEVENALCAHPAVQEAAVFGRPDPALGEVIHAAVVLRPGQKLTERELKAFLLNRLAAFKQPRTIKFLDKLPRNPSGKVLKREL